MCAPLDNAGPWGAADGLKPARWAQQLLLHAYTRTSPQHAAPVLTTIGYINCWEGKGSKAHQFLQLALDNDPAYRLARLSDQMIASDHVAQDHG